MPRRKATSPLATVVLFSALATTSVAFAQGVPAKAAEAARLQKLKAAQAATLKAAAAAKAAAVPTTPPPPVATINRPVPVVTPPPTATVVATTATVAPKSSAAPATSGSVKPATSAAPATSGSAAPAALATHAETAPIALDLEALKKSRPDRRHTEFLDLQSRWGNLLSDPRATAELTQHSQRIAYLQRIRGLGSKAKDETFVKGVDALITKEETRDADALNALRSGALPAPAAPAAAALPPTTPAPGASK